MKYTISYKKNNVFQIITVEAKEKSIAIAYFKDTNPKALYVGIREGAENKPGMPIITVPENYKK